MLLVILLLWPAASHLLLIFVASFASASAIASVGTSLLVLLIAATPSHALITAIVLIVRSFRATLFATPTSLSLHWHAHVHRATGAAWSPATRERYPGLLERLL